MGIDWKTCALLALAAACRPVGKLDSVTLPNLPPDARIEIDTKERLHTGSYDKVVGSACGSSGCTDFTRREAFALTYYDSTIRSGDQKISYGQLMVMGDPDRDAKIAAFERGA